METKNSNWERIESVINWANENPNSFARLIGLRRSENLYQIKRGNNGISRKIADMITEVFPAINKLWLLTGEGDMFAPAELSTAAKPLYNVGVEEHIRDIAALEPNDHLILPRSIDCDLAIPYMGRAMGQTTPPGSILLLKKIEADSIIPGDECVIVTKKIVLLRIVKIDRESGDEHRFRLVAEQDSKFDDVIVETHQIESLYKVKGKILINS